MLVIGFLGPNAPLDLRGRLPAGQGLARVRQPLHQHHLHPARPPHRPHSPPPPPPLLWQASVLLVSQVNVNQLHRPGVYDFTDCYQPVHTNQFPREPKKPPEDAIWSPGGEPGSPPSPSSPPPSSNPSGSGLYSVSSGLVIQPATVCFTNNFNIFLTKYIYPRL